MLGTLIGMATVAGMGKFDPMGMQHGHMYMMGLAPVVGLEKGSSITYNLADTGGRMAYEFGGQGYSAGATKATAGVDFKPLDLNKIQAETGKGVKTTLGKTVPTGLGATAMSAIGPLMSAGFIVSGFKENGFAGAMDAYFLDIATSRAINAVTFETVVNTGEGIGKKGLGTVTHTRRLGMLGGLGAGMGAFMGYEIGNQIAGVPGGFVGATMGSKAVMAFGRNPAGMGALILGGLAAKKAGEAVVSRVGHIVKKGYQRGKMRHRIDTAGSTAAFFTQNAITTRGRAFEAMRKSHLNARSALGMEASMTHMNRSYF